MADVFISYSHVDRPFAMQLADVLENAGLEVWWDRELHAGQDFGLLIDQEIRAATAVIVLWSKDSVKSRWVRGEAGLGADLGKVVPIKVNDCDLPISFRSLHTPEVFKSKEEFEKLIELLQSKINQANDDANSPAPNLKLETLEQVSSDSFWNEQWDVIKESTKQSYTENYVKGNEFGKRHPLIVLALIIAFVVLVYRFIVS